jgi:ABC-2 type transport system ATP-binding protein
MIMSILEPDAGRIEVLGGEARALKDAIGYLPETRGMYPRMRVGDYLRYIGRLKGMAPRAAGEAVDRWLARVELPDVHRSRCNDLSKGMLQKVQIVAAVMNAPALLILDEPFSGLDPLNAVHVLGIIEELRAAGTTILFSTHVLEQAERICDRILILNRGEKLEDGALETIRAAFDPLTVEVEPAAGSAMGPGDLADLDGVRGVYPVPDQRTWELRLRSDAEPEAVMQKVVARMPVRAIQLRRATLQDLFLQLVGEHEADG